MATLPRAYSYLGLLGILLFFACEREDLRPADYMAFSRDPQNGFVKQQQLADIRLKAFYQNPTYFALTQLSPTHISDSLLSAEIERNKYFYHFEFSIGSNSAALIDDVLKTRAGMRKEPSYESLKQKMLYSMGQYFSLHVHGDSIPCTFFLAQPNGKIDNAYHFLLAFETEIPIGENQHDPGMILCFRDSIWANQKFTFDFDNTALNQSPRLKI